jgi:pilus assembly protein Flp/PilA
VIGGLHQRFYALNKEGYPMQKLKKVVYLLRVWDDSFGQDLVEYALMAGFVAVACGAAFPPVANSVSQIFSKITSVLSSANGS